MEECFCLEVMENATSGGFRILVLVLGVWGSASFRIGAAQWGQGWCLCGSFVLFLIVSGWPSQLQCPSLTPKEVGKAESSQGHPQLQSLDGGMGTYTIASGTTNGKRQEMSMCIVLSNLRVYLVSVKRKYIIFNVTVLKIKNRAQAFM